MKKTPKDKRIERLLRSSRLVAEGFLGSDARDFKQIIDDDITGLEKLGYTVEKVAEMMRELTEAAKPMLGNPVEKGGLIVTYEDYKGVIVCPWPHPGRFSKAITTVKRLDTGETIRWTDLNIHMIAEHGFFEGMGSVFRIEPAKLVKIIFSE